MKNLINKNLISTLVLTFSLSACLNGGSTDSGAVPVEADSKNPTQTDGAGTSDGGGGIIDESTPEQIKKAISDARLMIVKKDFRTRFGNNIDWEILGDTELTVQVFEFLLDISDPSSVKHVEYLDMILKLYDEQEKFEMFSEEWNKLSQQIDDLREENEILKETLPSSLSEYVPGIPVIYKEDGPCVGTGNDDADASVSENTLAASICFSIEKLKRIPPQSLEKHIFGLWMHELGHMMGESEEDLVKALERVSIAAYSKFKTADQGRLQSKVMSILFMMKSTMLIPENNVGLALWNISQGDNINSEQVQGYVNRSYVALGKVHSDLRTFLGLYNNNAALDLFPETGDNKKRTKMVELAQTLYLQIHNLTESNQVELLTQENRELLGTMLPQFESLYEDFIEVEGMDVQTLN